MQKIYLLEYRDFYFHDEKDDEDVEDRVLLGYFSSTIKINEAIEICIQHKIDKSKLQITEYSFKANANQKYVYVLGYEYSILDKNEEYIDFFYNFEPMTNLKQCLFLKNQLIHENKYKVTENKIFDSETDNGFYVSKMQINTLYGIV